jgi:hypothetical protein
LPVLVGPSTAVTPAPGARPLEKLGGEEEKAMISGGFFDVLVLARPRVIARSEATKQSIVSVCVKDGLLRYARNDGEGFRLALD